MHMRRSLEATTYYNILLSFWAQFEKNSTATVHTWNATYNNIILTNVESHQIDVCSMYARNVLQIILSQHTI